MKKIHTKIHNAQLRRKLYFVLGALVIGGLLLFAGCSDSGAQAHSAGAAGEQHRGAAVSDGQGQRNGARGLAAVDETVGGGGGARAGQSLEPKGGRTEQVADRAGGVNAESKLIESFAGTLVSDGTEWYLETDQGTTPIHLGNSAFVESTGLALEDGDAVELEGIVEEDGIAVVTLTVRGEEFRFRGEDGRPLWAGQGNRQAQGGEGSGFEDEKGRQGGGRGNGGGKGRGTNGGEGGQSRGRSAV